MQACFSHLAGYNAWANRQLYDAVAKLSEDYLWRDVGLFFGSLGGTLNHLLVTDRVWMKRFTGTGDHPDRLDAILHRDPGALQREREAEDQRIIAYAAGLTDDALQGEFTYRRMTTPDLVTSKLWPDLIHLFNHQTHHRGQAHTGLDMIQFARTKSM